MNYVDMCGNVYAIRNEAMVFDIDIFVIKLIQFYTQK